MAIVHHVVSAGGVERLVNALISTIVHLPEAAGWKFTLLTAQRNSAGQEVRAERLLPERVDVRYLSDRRAGLIIDRMLGGTRVLGIRGTGRILSLLGRFLDRLRSRWFEGGLSPVRREIEKVLRDQDFDVAYFPYPYLIKAPAADTPMVGTFHDFNHRHSESLEPAMRARIDRQMKAWLQTCDRLVVSAEFIRRELDSFYPGFGSKTRLIRPALPFHEAAPTKRQLRATSEKWALPREFLLVTGWVVPHKNQAVVFKALSRLKNRGQALGLVCVGPNSHELKPEASSRSPYAEEIMRIVEEERLLHGKDYFVLGYVNDFDLQCLYKLADAVIISAVYEAGSFTGAEAMRAGCPVIFSRTPANLEQVALIDGNAWLFEPHDPDGLAQAVDEINEDRAKTAKICVLARERVAENLNWGRAAADYLKVFDEARRSRSSH